MHKRLKTPATAASLSTVNELTVDDIISFGWIPIQSHPFFCIQSNPDLDIQWFQMKDKEEYFMSYASTTGGMGVWQYAEGPRSIQSIKFSGICKRKDWFLILMQMIDNVPADHPLLDSM